MNTTIKNVFLLSVVLLVACNDKEDKNDYPTGTWTHYIVNSILEGESENLLYIKNYEYLYSENLSDPGLFFRLDDMTNVEGIDDLKDILNKMPAYPYEISMMGKSGEEKLTCLLLFDFDTSFQGGLTDHLLIQTTIPDVTNQIEIQRIKVTGFFVQFRETAFFMMFNFDIPEGADLEEEIIKTLEYYISNYNLF